MHEMWLGITFTRTEEVAGLEAPTAIEGDRKRVERMVTKSHAYPG